MSEEEAASIDLVNPRTAQDEPQIASYMNYLVTNHGCIVPQYGDKNDELAVETFQRFTTKYGARVFISVLASTLVRLCTEAEISTALRSRSPAHKEPNLRKRPLERQMT